MSVALACVAIGCAGPTKVPGSMVPARRLARLSSGVNVCRWFRKPPEHSDTFYANHVTDAEMEQMHQIGLRHVRLGIGPSEVMDLATGDLDAKKVVAIDRAIARFLKHDIAVVVDIHNESRPFLEDPGAGDRFVAFWSQFAKHLSRTDPERVFLEIVNEPVFGGREGEWFDLQGRLAVAIRQNAPKHTIIATGPNWGGVDGLRKLKPLPDTNVVYSFHFYEPFTFTHQGATWTGPAVRPLRTVPYPSSPDLVQPLLDGLPSDASAALRKYGDERWDTARLKARFQEAADWGTQHKVPLYCGEFAVLPKFALPEHTVNWYRDMGEFLAVTHVGWAVWGWDEPFGLRKGSDGALAIDPVVAGMLGLKVP